MALATFHLVLIELIPVCAGVARGPAETRGHREGHHPGGPGGDGSRGIPQTGQT